MTFDEFLPLIEDRSAALRSAVSADADLSARVPGCPEWTLRDLVAHLGGVQRLWAEVVRTGSRPGDLDNEPRGDLIEWSAESTRLLVAALREAGPDKPCWTWWEPSDAPSTSGAVARHQVQEAAIHAWDAESATGVPAPIPAAVAVDAVGEFLVVSLGSEGPWPHRPARVTLAAVEGPSWTVDLTPAGAQFDPPASGEAVTTVHGAASDLLLALFGRISPKDLRIEGDPEVFEQILAWADTE